MVQDKCSENIGGLLNLRHARVQGWRDKKLKDGQSGNLPNSLLLGLKSSLKLQLLSVPVDFSQSLWSSPLSRLFVVLSWFLLLSHDLNVEVRYRWLK